MLKIFPLAGLGLAILLGLTLCSTPSYFYPKTIQELSEASVKIVNRQGSSGGSGVILKSFNTYSNILTNRHVCKLLSNGGTVIGEQFSTPVTSYVLSNEHDLCLITVSQNLKINTRLASHPPDIYSEARVVGHPHLLPTIVTIGHFSSRETIEVMMGSHPCTKKDLNSSNALMCLIFGQMPEIESFDAIVVSALIQPGSSGSPIFNDQGEICGVVFAGSGDLSFTYAVPHEAIERFLYKEIFNLKESVPNHSITIGQS